MTSLCKQGSACPELTCESAHPCEHCDLLSTEKWYYKGNVHRVCDGHYDSMGEGVMICVYGIKCMNPLCGGRHPSCNHSAEQVENVRICKMHYPLISTGVPVCIHGVFCRGH
jgi:hypothetical protein